MFVLYRTFKSSPVSPGYLRLISYGVPVLSERVNVTVNISLIDGIIYLWGFLLYNVLYNPCPAWCKYMLCSLLGMRRFCHGEALSLFPCSCNKMQKTANFGSCACASLHLKLWGCKRINSWCGLTLSRQLALRWSLRCVSRGPCQYGGFMPGSLVV